MTHAPATFSPCRTYRYQLARDVDITQTRTLGIIGLNPSTADETANDPTIRREMDFARRWGFRCLLKGNVFALRATDPRVMRAHPEPIGPDNDAHLLAIAKASDLVIAAWGVHGVHRDRGAEVRAMLELAGCTLHHLGLTKDGHPRHPLYLTASTEPTAWGSP